MVSIMKTQVNTTETAYEYDENGKVIKKTVTETVAQEPDEYITCTCGCAYDDVEDEITTALEGVIDTEYTALDVITAAAGVASIVASVCLIAKALRKE